MCAKIAKCSCESGNKAAAIRGHSFSESTMRNTKKTYLSMLSVEKDCDKFFKAKIHFRQQYFKNAIS